MKEGKDIVDLSAGFIAGIVAGSLVLPQREHAFLYASLCFSCLCICITLIWHFHLRKMSVIHILMFITGLSCIFTSKASSAFALFPTGGTDLFGPLSKRTADIIDNIPFSSPDCNALMKALTLGDKTSLDPKVTAAFRESGAAHILALSGLHLGILYMILSKLLRLAGNYPLTRILRSVSIILMTGIYVLATGASPSLVRAWLFILLNEIAFLTCRKTNLSRILCSALFIQLVLDPEVIGNVGFQLSYLAMAGICWIYPFMKGWYPEAENGGRDLPIMRKLWDMASLTLSCQLTTAPAVLYYFGTLPRYFLVTNLIALPLTTFSMSFLLLILGLSTIGICPTILTDIGSSLLEALMYVMKIISEL